MALVVVLELIVAEVDVRRLAAQGGHIIGKNE
jgi:hypothetical protein